MKEVLKFDKRSANVLASMLILVPSCLVKIVNEHLDPFKKFSRLKFDQQQSQLFIACQT